MKHNVENEKKTFSEVFALIYFKANVGPISESFVQIVTKETVDIS